MIHPIHGQYKFAMSTTTTYYPENNLTVVLHGSEGMQKALEEFSAREAAKRAAKEEQDLENECLDAILHHQEHTYALRKPEVYKLCMERKKRSGICESEFPQVGTFFSSSLVYCRIPRAAHNLMSFLLSTKMRTMCAQEKSHTLSDLSLIQMHIPLIKFQLRGQLDFARSHLRN
jgi:hypothetical protein